MSSTSELHVLHPLAVVLPVLAFLVVLIDLPPLIWHVRHRNVAAGCFILHLILLNFMSFLNALIWPRDNFEDWFHGDILCDIEVRLHLFASFGIGVSLICVFKSLADVLDTSKAVTSVGRDAKTRKIVLELLLCIGAPLLFILVYYVVQSQRYAILGISGCAFMWDGTWLGIVLCMMWFPVLQVIASIRAGVVIYRLIRYSRMFSTMLQNHNSTRSRFYRTFIMSLFLIACNLPAILYNFVKAFPLTGSYSWEYTHSDWDTIYLYPSHGHVNPDVWSSLIGGVLVFVFFGTGQEALKMYRGWLVKIGAARIWPSLREIPMRRPHNSDDKWTLLERKARSLFGRSKSDSFADTGTSHTMSTFSDPEMVLPSPNGKRSISCTTSTELDSIGPACVETASWNA